ncbi:MAG: hypothetical protein K2W85_05025 [Phycisphaerales bacterium]|nr:hypothetical protein [Phycisphaerales bacterium]
MISEVADRARGWLGKVRVALGGRDLDAEVIGYALAIKGASADQAAEIVDRLGELVESHAGPRAMAIVAGVWTRLDPKHRVRVVALGHGVWPEACAITAIDPDPAARASVATLIGALCEPRALGLLKRLLADRDPLVAEAAGLAVMTIADRSMQDPPLDLAGRTGVREAVAEGVCAFDRHRRRETLGALLRMCATPVGLKGCRSHLEGLIDDGEHPAHMVLRGMLRRGDALATREAAWSCMSIEPWRSACIDRLGLSTDSEGVARVLERGHLLANPARATALARVRESVRRGRSPGLDIDAPTLEALPKRAASHASRWLTCIHGTDVAQRLEPLLAHDCARVRLAGMLAMTAAPGAGGGAAIDFAFDPEARIARAAAMRMSTPSVRAEIAPQHLRRTANALCRSEHAAVRSMATDLASAMDPLSGSGQSRLVARRQFQADPAAFAAELQDVVRRGPLARRLRAIAIARQLGIGARIELELLSIIHRSAVVVDGVEALSPERREVMHSAAAAVTLLAELPSPAAQHAVHRCLRHADARVRANALDAMARVARRRGVIAGEKSALASAMVEFKNDEHHRVRAAAVRAGVLAAISGGDLRLTESVSGDVGAMLTDARVMHRVSGLWLAERVAGMCGAPAQLGQTIASAVADIVRNEPDIQVRIRARQTGERLMATMRSGWSGRAASL